MKNPEHQGRMKHIDPIYHGFRECVEHNEIAPYYVPTQEMAADILTKPLDRQLVVNGVSMLGLKMETWWGWASSGGCVAGIYLEFSGFILAFWCDFCPGFSTQNSHQFLIILLYDFDSMPHFSVFLSIFYHPRIRVKCGLYCFYSHFLLLGNVISPARSI